MVTHLEPGLCAPPCALVSKTSLGVRLTLFGHLPRASCYGCSPSCLIVELTTGEGTWVLADVDQNSKNQPKNHGARTPGKIKHSYKQRGNAQTTGRGVRLALHVDDGANRGPNIANRAPVFI